MATPTTSLFALFSAIIATLLIGTAAETYTVGDSLGWTVPPGGEIAYRTWASRHDIKEGDIVVFNWTSTHTVARVSEEAYKNCSVNNTLSQVYETSPVNFTINNGSQYFICTIGPHCSLGQRVTIIVGPSSGASFSTPTAALSAIASAIAISFLSFM